jgi:hypothetical protein
MKRGKRLTRDQKAIVLGNGLDPKDYMFAYVVDEHNIKVVNVHTGIETLVNVHKKQKRV